MKRLTFFLLALALASMAQSQTVTHVYHYNNPVVSERDGYQQIGLEGCLPQGQVGEPTLPWQDISLILPQGQKAVSMQVEFADFVEMEGNYELYPYQKPRPCSNEEVIPFAKNENLYRSSNPYPTRNRGEISTQYLNGVAFAFGGFKKRVFVCEVIVRCIFVRDSRRTRWRPEGRRCFRRARRDRSFFRGARSCSPATR